MSLTDGERMTQARARRLQAQMPTTYRFFKDGDTYRADPCYVGGTAYAGDDAAVVFQNTFDTVCTLGGGKIQCQRGDYTLDSTIDMNNATGLGGIVIQGEGMHAGGTRFIANHSNEMFKMDVGISYMWGLTLKDLQIKGIVGSKECLYLSADSGSTAGISALYLENVYCRSAGTHGFFGQRIWGATFVNSWFGFNGLDGAGCGVYTTLCDEMAFLGCKMPGNYGDAAAKIDWGAYNLFSGCTIGGDGCDYGLWLIDPIGTKVDTCAIVGKVDALRIAGDRNGGGTPSNTVDTCHFEGYVGPPAGPTNNIHLVDGDSVWGGAPTHITVKHCSDNAYATTSVLIDANTLDATLWLNDFANAVTDNGTRTKIYNYPVEVCQIYTGQYVGDGGVNHAITGVGFPPKAVWIEDREVTATTALVYFKSDQHFGNLSNLVSAGTTVDNRILSLDADGFTVSDGGTDVDPNKNGRTYLYVAWG